MASVFLQNFLVSTYKNDFRVYNFIFYFNLNEFLNIGNRCSYPSFGKQTHFPYAVFLKLYNQILFCIYVSVLCFQRFMRFLKSYFKCLAQESSSGIYISNNDVALFCGYINLQIWATATLNRFSCLKHTWLGPEQQWRRWDSFHESSSPLVLSILSIFNQSNSLV